MSLLEVKDLSVTFATNDGTVRAVNQISFDIKAGHSLAIVGESGSGKSQAVFAIMGLLADNGTASGTVSFNGQQLMGLSDNELNKIRANEIAMIFQDPMTSLNPYMRVQEQMIEVLTLHKGMGRSEAFKECIKMLDAVQLPDARSVIRRFPHECSGGMRQRIMIAISLLCHPKLLIADEPTTALDVTVQAQIMQLLKKVREDFGTSLILITHDLAVVAGSCENTLVMYGGRIMEYARTRDLFARPSHPYTRGLLSAVPRLDSKDDELQTIAGSPPNMMILPAGCPFAERCDYVMDICRVEMPQLLDSAIAGQQRACHLPVEELK
ncbi:Oligopeptide transport ATP-binding protein OppD (TC 3.A.1.5.1) [hydrothermal vent metagenome]|uniref:Oligopeptide transport ATP-binding protein OppD (TC 3.A.1.5.1) n=1 Tax=hydrothermal vent metagenome TaxID=652676 RepID=A0A3B0T9M7_9ZZZZ